MLNFMVPYRCFYKWGGLVAGVLVVRAVAFGVYAGAADFWKPPYSCNVATVSGTSNIVQNEVLVII